MWRSEWSTRLVGGVRGVNGLNLDSLGKKDPGARQKWNVAACGGEALS